MSPFPMSDRGFERLRYSAQFLNVRVWRAEDDVVFMQLPGREPERVEPSTLAGAGWIHCPLQPAPCRCDAQHRALGQRVACTCGQVSMRLPAVILARLAGMKKPATRAG